jgi:hypothetical protein
MIRRTLITILLSGLLMASLAGPDRRRGRLPARARACPAAGAGRFGCGVATSGR